MTRVSQINSYLRKIKKLILNQIYNKKLENEDNKQYRRLSYIGNSSLKIGHELKQCNIIPAYYNNYTIKNILVNNKLSLSDPYEHSGIYQIKCTDCKYTYIGQTGRTFNIRFNDHMRSYKNNKLDSNFAIHLNEMNHTCEKNNLEILHIASKGPKMDFLEAYEIQKAINKGSNILNDQVDLFHSDVLKILIEEFSN